ncbi:hypothetical protein SAMN02745248_01514 [Hathewaya proteolytica DSM 3090]|uniref:Uncharacterized protein n=1 Tax=Hathewaya proteolytica DSM 3090 TaxID=1121331 RepID=A0A1M6NVL5_9CLOT|nr:hypothetical protein SAMN02745248_01514 [Hathewaya proteolytica DSM 3090]
MTSSNFLEPSHFNGLWCTQQGSNLPPPDSLMHDFMNYTFGIKRSISNGYRVCLHIYSVLVHFKLLHPLHPCCTLSIVLNNIVFKLYFIIKKYSYTYEYFFKFQNFYFLYIPQHLLVVISTVEHYTMQYNLILKLLHTEIILPLHSV